MRRSVRRWSRREKKTKEKEAEVCWVCNEGSFRFFLDFLLGFFFFWDRPTRSGARRFRISNEPADTSSRGPRNHHNRFKKLFGVPPLFSRTPPLASFTPSPTSLSLSLSRSAGRTPLRAPLRLRLKKKNPKKRKKKKNNTKREKKNKKNREKEMKTRRGFQSSPLDSAPLFFFVSFYLWKKKRSISLFLSFGPIRPGLCCT